MNMKTKPYSYDPEKAKELRVKVMECALEVLDGKDISSWSKYKKELVLKMSSRVLPILNAGRDDDKDLIPQPIINVHTNPSDKQNTAT